MRVNPRLFAWWYFAIALGYILLAINQGFISRSAWGVILRLVIAAGFAALGYIELRSRVRK
jgi:hypothetical protein